jgi:hypothetical protein
MGASRNVGDYDNGSPVCITVSLGEQVPTRGSHGEFVLPPNQATAVNGHVHEHVHVTVHVLVDVAGLFIVK